MAFWLYFASGRHLFEGVEDFSYLLDLIFLQARFLTNIPNYLARDV